MHAWRHTAVTLDIMFGPDWREWLELPWAGPAIYNQNRQPGGPCSRSTELPISTFEEPTPERLWAALRAQCIDAGRCCDVMAIPHNGNQSNGNLFPTTFASAAE